MKSAICILPIAFTMAACGSSTTTSINLNPPDQAVVSLESSEIVIFANGAEQTIDRDAAAAVFEPGTDVRAYRSGEAYAVAGGSSGINAVAYFVPGQAAGQILTGSVPDPFPTSGTAAADGNYIAIYVDEETQMVAGYIKGSVDMLINLDSAVLEASGSITTRVTDGGQTLDDPTLNVASIINGEFVGTGTGGAFDLVNFDTSGVAYSGRVVGVTRYPGSVATVTVIHLEDGSVAFREYGSWAD